MVLAIFATVVITGLLLTYAWIGYPVLIALCAKIWGKQPIASLDTATSEQSIAVILAAHNEEDVIGPRITNLLEQQGLQGPFEILVGLDGCVDGTLRELKAFDDPRLRVFDFKERRGKSSVVNDLVSRTQADVLVFTDANTDMQSDAIARLSSWFSSDNRSSQDTDIVCGKLQLVDASTGRNADGLYWKIENLLKESEASVGGLLGANGAIYAMRRRAYLPIPADTMVDDFTIPLLSKKILGSKIAFDQRALACEESAPDLADEWRRRKRIGAGGFQALCRLAGLLNPVHGWTTLSFTSHKLLRWLGPFLLIWLFVGSLICWSLPAAKVLLAVQMIGYTIAFAGWVRPSSRRLGRISRLAALFAAVNVGLLAGFVTFAKGAGGGAWERTSRA